MALALGLGVYLPSKSPRSKVTLRFSGSLFNHSRSPNVSYRLERETESIRYTTTRAIIPDEELCIFYGHSLWFQPADVVDIPTEADEQADDWAGLTCIQIEEEETSLDGPYLDGSPDDLLAEENLPFTRMKLLNDEAEDQLDAVQTGASTLSRRSVMLSLTTAPLHRASMGC